MSINLTVEKMMGYLYELPEQFFKSLEMEFDLPAAYHRNYQNIVVSGLGGSAIGGDILRNYMLKKAPIPVLVNRDYDVPALVGEGTLFLAVSYSGNTEETLSSYEQAQQAGAFIICLTGGGKLAERAAANGNPLVKIPGGLVPRAATGFLFAPMALLLEQMGVVTGVRQELEETVTVLRQLRDTLNPNVNAPYNQARVIATALKDTIPVIWGAAGVSEAAALRWKAQINENAKSPAYYNVFPELNHNEVVGFEVPADLLSRFSYIILKDRYDNPRIQKRMEITRDIIEDKVKNVIEVESQGESFLTRLYSLIYVGDYASVYLALEYGINPTPVEIIDYLKAQLAK